MWTPHGEQWWYLWIVFTLIELVWFGYTMKQLTLLLKVSGANNEE